MDNSTINFDKNNIIYYELSIPRPYEFKKENSVILGSMTKQKLNKNFPFLPDAMMVVVYSPNLAQTNFIGKKWNQPYLDKTCKSTKLGTSYTNGITDTTRYIVDFFLQQFNNGINKSNLLLYAKHCGYMQLAGIFTGEKNTNENEISHKIYFASNPYWTLGKEKITDRTPTR